jgi:AraC-like DNA-binding protein
MTFHIFVGLIISLVCIVIFNNPKFKFLIYSKYSISEIVGCYLVAAPLYHLVTIIFYLNTTVTSVIWIAVVPLGAYLFFERKKIILFSLYALSIVLLGITLEQSNIIVHNSNNSKKIIYLDFLAIVFNIIIVSLVLYYKELIRNIQFIDEKENIDVENIDVENILIKIDTIIQEKMLFTDQNFNLQKLSQILPIKSVEISKVLRYKGYNNFNSYLNTLRINYIKQLLNETDLQKVTLMYIYTKAGFQNQSTFNRVFKQIEGVTPSEYTAKLIIKE